MDRKGDNSMGRFTFVKGHHFFSSEYAADQLQEGFVVDEGRILAQVSAEHIEDIMKKYLRKNEGMDIFFFVEVPTSVKEEKILVPSNDGIPGMIEAVHRDVYYLDHIDSEIGLSLLDTFGDILINDGLSVFGFGTVDSEIGKYKYNEMVLFYYDEDKMPIDIFLQSNIPEKKELVFAGTLFSEDNPGVSDRYEDASGRSVDDVVEVLKEAGLYKVEVRTDE